MATESIISSQHPTWANEERISEAERSMTISILERLSQVNPEALKDIRNKIAEGEEARRFWQTTLRYLESHSEYTANVVVPERAILIDRLNNLQSQIVQTSTGRDWRSLGRQSAEVLQGAIDDLSVELKKVEDLATKIWVIRQQMALLVTLYREEDTRHTSLLYHSST